MTDAEVIRAIRALYPYSRPPKPLGLFQARAEVLEGRVSVAEAAKLFGTTRGVIEATVQAENPLGAIFGLDDVSLLESPERRLRSILGQLIIGRLAEIVFEGVYRDRVGSPDLELRDDRSTRGDTDYFVFNGGGKQLFRLNIKFFGSRFRRAEDMVSLDPADCFALATYKIHSALQKQENEHLPYIFAIVGVPDLTGAAVGAEVPTDLVWLLHLATTGRKRAKRRDLEDRIAERMIQDPGLFGFEPSVQRYLAWLSEAPWYILSARKADQLLKEWLFERCYALRVRAYARNYQGEIDMHFSLSRDLTPLEEFLQTLKEGGMQKLIVALERGTI